MDLGINRVSTAYAPHCEPRVEGTNFPGKFKPTFEIYVDLLSTVSSLDLPKVSLDKTTATDHWHNQFFLNTPSLNHAQELSWYSMCLAAYLMCKLQSAVVAQTQNMLTTTGSYTGSCYLYCY